MSANDHRADGSTCCEPFEERPCKTIWPTLGATRLGRWIGRVALVGPGSGPLRLGTLLVVLLVPLVVGLYLWQILPPRVRRYHLTTRRIIIQKGLPPRVEASLDLEQFEAIGVEVQPGQEYFRAADLVFLRGQRELLRLAGVGRPDVVRQLCLETRATFLWSRDNIRRQQTSGERLSPAAPGAAG